MGFSAMLSSLIKLGNLLNDTFRPNSDGNGTLTQLIHQQHFLNNWHTTEDLVGMLRHLGDLLSEESLISWMKDIPGKSLSLPRSPALIKPNPNYSFAGIQEWLCCLVTQTPMAINANENQFQILKFLAKKLEEYDNQWKGYFDIHPGNNLKPEKYILYAEKKNDSVYQYFNNKKSVIIEPRPSIAVLAGNETGDEIARLGQDIFMHLGQSNRTLRKIFIPESFEIKNLIEALEPFSKVYSNNKFANNYDYHQSVYLMNKIPFLDNGFLIFKEDQSDFAPTGCLFYEYYNQMDTLLEKIKEKNFENLICSEKLPVKTIKPGQSHFFNLTDYPNGKNLVEFLLTN